MRILTDKIHHTPTSSSLELEGEQQLSETCTALSVPPPASPFWGSVPSGGSLAMYVTCVWVPDITQSRSFVLVEVGVSFESKASLIFLGLNLSSVIN